MARIKINKFTNFTGEDYNQRFYDTQKIVELFYDTQELQPPEETILKLLGKDLKKMSMLDIGVGAGRTTRHFAPKARQYIGIDYSPKMIAACQHKFPRLKNSFILADARDMSIFKNHYFDFVFFSFNGIDYVDNKDRMTIFNEIKRIIKIGGLFCFSTHNLRNIEKLFKKQPGLRGFIKYILLNFYNEPKKQLSQNDHVIINDGACSFGLKTYYILPEVQIEELNQSGFKNIRLFASENGKEIDRKQLKTVQDPWIYYLAKLS